MRLEQVGLEPPVKGLTDRVTGGVKMDVMLVASTLLFVANGEMVIWKGVLWPKGENSNFTC